MAIYHFDKRNSHLKNFVIWIHHTKTKNRHEIGTEWLVVLLGFDCEIRVLCPNNVS